MRPGDAAVRVSGAAFQSGGAYRVTRQLFFDFRGTPELLNVKATAAPERTQRIPQDFP